MKKSISIRFKSCVALTALFCLSFLKNGTAQETLELSLSNCVQKALFNSAQVSKAKLDKTALIYKQKEQRQAILPQLNTYIDLSAAPILQTQFLNSSNLSPTDAAVPVQFGRTWNLQLGLTVQQLVFDEKLRRLVPASKLGDELANYAVTKSENEVIFQTAQLYFSILKTEALLATLESNASKLGGLEKSAKLLLDNDLGTALDGKRIKVAQVNLEGKKRELLAAIAYQKDLLRAFCGLEAEKELNLSTDNQPLYIQALTPQLAMEERMLNSAMELTKTQIHASKATVFPTLGAYASAGVQAPRNNANFFETDSRWYGAMLLGVRAQSPTFDGSKHKIRILEVEMRKHQETLEQFRTIQEVERRNKKALLASAQETLLIFEKNVELAKEVESQMQLQYKEGYIGLSEVLNAQTALVESESNLKQQQIAVRMAELDVLKIMGQLDLLFD